MKSLPIYALIAIAVLIAVGMGTLEMSGNTGQSLMEVWGTRILIWTLNLGGILIFWIAADIKRKNEKHGWYALLMAISIRLFAYLYILHIAGFDIWPLGTIDEVKISDYVSKLMLFGNTVILFCERLVHYYSDPKDYFKEETERLVKQANAWEKQAKQDERNRIHAEVQLKALQEDLNASEDQANEALLQVNTYRKQFKEYEDKLNTVTEKLKTYEYMKEFFESNVDTPIPYGNTYCYHSSKSKKLYGWGRESILEVDGKKIKKPMK